MLALLTPASFAQFESGVPMNALPDYIVYFNKIKVVICVALCS
jgi:hypothetical protein